MSVVHLSSQPVDATHALNLSAGVSNPSVLLAVQRASHFAPDAKAIVVAIRMRRRYAFPHRIDCAITFCVIAMGIGWTAIIGLYLFLDWPQ